MLPVGLAVHERRDDGGALSEPDRRSGTRDNIEKSELRAERGTCSVEQRCVIAGWASEGDQTRLVCPGCLHQQVMRTLKRSVPGGWIRKKMREPEYAHAIAPCCAAAPAVASAERC